MPTWTSQASFASFSTRVVISAENHARLEQASVMWRPVRGVARCDTPRCHVVIADHYTLRLAPGIRQRLTEWARRAGLPERTLAQHYVKEGLRHDVEEGLRHDAHPLIQFLDGPSDRRASLLSRGLDVWEVIATVRDNNGSIADAAEYLQVPPGLVEAAVAYYGEYRD